jgi:hypothetical protein
MVRKVLRVGAVGIVALAVVAGSAAVASASVQTDGYNYLPGDTVSITGNEMQPLETVMVQVTFPDGSLAQQHEVAADDQGAFADAYILPLDAPAGVYGVVATGETSGARFTTEFDPNGNGALDCPTLNGFNPTHYGLPAGSSVTCTIDGASEVSGLSTVDVIIKSSDLGNTTVTGTVTGTGDGTQITFTFDAPSDGCNTTIVAYQSDGLNANNSIITPGGKAAAGFAYLDGNGNSITCGDAASVDVEKVADESPIGAGATMGFLITVTSTGPGTANDVVLTDPLPTTPGTSWSIDGGTGAGACTIDAGVMTCDFGSMPDGTSQTVHITSPTTRDSVGDTTNTATVTSSNGGSDESSDTVTVICPLFVQVTPDAKQVAQGGQMGFAISIVGRAQSDTYDVTLQAKLPGGQWSIDPASSAGCSISGKTLTCDLDEIGLGESRWVHVTAIAQRTGTALLRALCTASNMDYRLNRQATIKIV